MLSGSTAARFGVPVGDERPCLALADEAERFQAVDRHVRERVVDHQVPDVTNAGAGLGEGGLAGQPEGLRLGEISHLRDHRRLGRLAGAEDVYGRLGEVARAIGGRDDQRAAAVGDQAAFEQVEGVGDEP